MEEHVKRNHKKSGQIICCGAPETGKSHKTETDLQNVPEWKQVQNGITPGQRLLHLCRTAANDEHDRKKFNINR